MSVDFKEYTRKMEKTLDVLQDNFGAVRAGRAKAKVLDRITVEYYGVDTPLAQVGTISSPDARTLVIQPWDTKLLKEIQKAIQVSDLGINPQNDGPCHPPGVPPAHGGAPERPDQAGPEVCRGGQGGHAEHPPGRHGLCEGGQEEK